MSITPEQLNAMLAKTPDLANPNRNARVAKREYRKPTITQSGDDFHNFANGIISKPLNVSKISPKKRQLLNKTETLWLAELQRRAGKLPYKETIWAQSFTFRLGEGLSYRPDFSTTRLLENGGQQYFQQTCYETKAPHRYARAGINKLKMAAKLYPHIRWVLIMRDGNSWTEKEIGE